MRLLQLEHNGKFSLTEYVGKNVPPFAILSHTWGVDNEEVTFRDIRDGTGRDQPGYTKLTFCAKRAAHDGLQFFWVDTCCTIQTHHRRQCTTESAAYIAESGGTMYIAF
ncbi:hypothetical protein DE146DRAFT_647243 [Phaeosphaeria sp. MPI-PUGE-AT-0046c]|nr:hypothetical protein DE146DRAFT_647243 [Phaeosphaeria sp. MPI-PUGE-AT-0046c]